MIRRLITLLALAIYILVAVIPGLILLVVIGPKRTDKYFLPMVDYLMEKLMR